MGYRTKTFHLDEALHYDLRLLCRLKGISLQDAVWEAVAAYVEFSAEGMAANLAANGAMPKPPAGREMAAVRAWAEAFAKTG